MYNRNEAIGHWWAADKERVSLIRPEGFRGCGVAILLCEIFWEGQNSVPNSWRGTQLTWRAHANCIVLFSRVVPRNVENATESGKF